MDFCGRCGHELGRGLERGRFCPKCGHETPGNARYPLYADGTAAVTRPRPAAVSQVPDETVVAAVPVGAAARAAHGDRAPEKPAATAPAASSTPASSTPASSTPASSTPATPAAEDVTRRRIPIIGDAQVVEQRSAESWKITVAVTLAAMVVVVLLGIFLLLH